MAIILTQEELDYMEVSRAAGFDLDESVTTAGANEGLYEETLPTGRKILAVHHHLTDKLTIYSVVEAPVPEPMVKLANFLSNNPDVKELLGL